MYSALRLFALSAGMIRILTDLGLIRPLHGYSSPTVSASDLHKNTYKALRGCIQLNIRSTSFLQRQSSPAFPMPPSFQIRSPSARKQLEQIPLCVVGMNRLYPLFNWMLSLDITDNDLASQARLLPHQMLSLKASDYLSCLEDRSQVISILVTCPSRLHEICHSITLLSCILLIVVTAIHTMVLLDSTKCLTTAGRPDRCSPVINWCQQHPTASASPGTPRSGRFTSPFSSFNDIPPYGVRRPNILYCISPALPRHVKFNSAVKISHHQKSHCKPVLSTITS